MKTDERQGQSTALVFKTMYLSLYHPILVIRIRVRPGHDAHTCNLGPQEAEAEGYEVQMPA